MNYEYYGTTYYDNGLGSLFGGALIVLSLITLALGIFAIVIMWKIFEKAGKPGWISLIPFYNTYTLFEITWGNGLMFLTIFLIIIPILGYIAVFVITIMTMSKLSKAFGKDTAFTVGLIFLSAIFMAILAFDSSTYQGILGKNSNVTAQNTGNQNQYNSQQTNTYQESTQNNQMGYNETTNSQAQTMNNQSLSFCSNCGTSLPPDAAFCPNCGTPKKN